MGAWRMARVLNSAQRNTFIASFLGWTLDAYDFFVVSFVVIHIASELHQTINAIVLTITVTLALRWLGALIFGIMADRFGRRMPLMVDILFYSVVELATAFSPNYTVFLILRGLYGIGMGGEWGIGASLAMESLPTESRGLFSGILQEGYSLGYLLAAVVFAAVFPHFGWRPMFVIGAAPALLVLFIRARVPESPVWLHQRTRRMQSASSIVGTIKSHLGLFIFGVLLMTAFNYMSHGTQDLYPTFLEKQRGLSTGTVSTIAVIYNIGAILGGTIFGYYSQRWGRRRTIIVAAILGILIIPLWVFAPITVWLAVGAFLMQFMVQGAWGVIPIHLNEISPGSVRGTFPGFTYQMGNLLSAPAALLEAAFAGNFKSANGSPNYGVTQAILAFVVFVAVIIFTALSRERHGVDFIREESADTTDRERPFAAQTGPVSTG